MDSFSEMDVHAQGLRVHYAQAGRSGPRIVLLHETPRRWTSYGPAMAHLSRWAQVYAFDTPGYGQSERPRRPISFIEYSDILSHAIAQVVPGRFWVAGVHTGAGLAASMAANEDRPIAGLVLTGLPLYHVVAPPPALSQVAPPIPIDGGGHFLDLIKSYLASKPELALCPSAVYDATAGLIDCLDAYDWAYRALFTAAPLDLAAIKCPVTFLTCTEDVLAKHDVHAAQRIVGAHVRWAEGIGRNLPWHAPKWYSDALHSSIAGSVPASSGS